MSTDETSRALLLHNTMRITEGHLEPFKDAVRRAVEFVEEHGPQLMVQTFIDDDALLAHSFQLYPDSEAVLAHWKMSDPYISDVMDHCTVESLEWYGEPSPAVRENLSTDAPKSFVPRVVGFFRAPAAT